MSLSSWSLQATPSLPLRSANSLEINKKANSLSGQACYTAWSCEVSKSRDSGSGFANHFEIWLASRRQCCWDACQISGRCDSYNIQSGGFETSRDLASHCLVKREVVLQRSIKVTSHVRHVVSNNWPLNCLSRSLLRLKLKKKKNIRTPHYWTFVRRTH